MSNTSKNITKNDTGMGLIIRRSRECNERKRKVTKIREKKESEIKNLPACFDNYEYS